MERREQTALAFGWLLCCTETSVCNRTLRANDLSVFEGTRPTSGCLPCDGR